MGRLAILVLALAAPAEPAPQGVRLTIGPVTWPCGRGRCGPAQETHTRQGSRSATAWRFDHRPVEGPLELEVAFGSETQPLFSDGRWLQLQHRDTRFTWGDATWIDATGARTRVRVDRRGPHAVLTVPAGLLTTSRYPAVLDPVLTREEQPDAPVISASGHAHAMVPYGDGALLWFAPQNLQLDRGALARLSTAAVPVRLATVSIGADTFNTREPGLAVTDAGVVLLAGFATSSVLALQLADLDGGITAPFTPVAEPPFGPITASPLVSAGVSRVLLGTSELFPDGGSGLMVTGLTPRGEPIDGGRVALPGYIVFRGLAWDGARHLALLQGNDAGTPFFSLVDLGVDGTSAAPAVPVDATLLAAAAGSAITLRPRVQLEFQLFEGGVAGAIGAVPVQCASAVVAALGDGWAVGCGGSVSSDFALKTIIVSRDAGVVVNDLIAADGGELRAASIAGSSSGGWVAWERRYYYGAATLRHEALYAQPLTTSGTAAGLAVELAQRPNVQRPITFASDGTTTLVSWYDDRELLGEPAAWAMWLDLDGGRLRPPFALEPTNFFTHYPFTAKYVASNGSGFLAATGDGFEVSVQPWSYDGGAGAKTQLVSTGLNVDPIVIASPSQYLVIWQVSGLGLRARRVRPDGATQGSAFDLVPDAGAPAGLLPDALWDGERFLVAGAGGGQVQLWRVPAAGSAGGAEVVAALDAGTTVQVRLALDAIDRSTLVVWAERAESLVARRCPADAGGGVALGTILQVPGLVSWDLASIDGGFRLAGSRTVADGGSSLWLAELRGAGTALGPEDLAPLDGLPSQYSPVVLGPVLGPGQLLGYAREHPELGGSPSSPATRVHYRFIGADLPIGAPCLSAVECVTRLCAGTCCPDTGCAVVSPDAGSTADGGTMPGSYAVGCGCGTTPVDLAIALAVLLLVRRRAFGRAPIS